MEQQLKQRLVGAVVLVSLAVIFIPIILEGPRDELAPRSQNIPEPPPLDFSTDLQLPLPDTGDAADVAPVAASPAPSAGEAARQDSDAAPAAVGEAEPAAAPAPPAAQPPRPRQPPAPATLADGWYAQVGSFSQQANAAALRERLGKAGYSAHLQQADTGKGSSYRVLVGPETEREGAEKLLQKLARELQLKGIVIEMSGAAG